MLRFWDLLLIWVWTVLGIPGDPPGPIQAATDREAVRRLRR